MNTVFRAISVSTCATLVLLISACGGGDKKSKATGVVTYKNAPVPGGNINFISNSGGGSYSSPLQMDGTYTVTDMPAGTYAVTVETESVNPDKMGGVAGGKTKAQPGSRGAGSKIDQQYAAAMGKGGSGVPGGEAGNVSFGAASREELLKRYTKIPLKYKAKETSGLTIEIEQGTVTKDFALTD